MKRKIGSIAVAVIMAAALLAGCGNKSTGAANETDTTASEKTDGSKEEKKADETKKAEQKTESFEEAKEMTVTDMAGRVVTIPAGAEKFAAIGPGCLRLYCYVADTSALVGAEQIEIDDATGRSYVMADKDIQKLSSIGAGGPTNAPDPEKLLTADPDVIFTCYNSDVAAIDDLQEKTGIPVVSLSYGEVSVFDPAVDESLTLVGKITGHEKRAEEIIRYIADAKADLNERTKDIPEEDRPVVYLAGQSMRGSHGIESTSGNYALFDAVNARNVVSEAGIHEYVMLDKEKILEMDPEIIIVEAGGLPLILEDYESDPSFYEGLQAVKNNRLYLQLPYNYYSCNIDVAIADAYYFGTLFYPEEFQDIDPAKKFDEITTEMVGAPLYAEYSEAYGTFGTVTLK